MATVWRIEFQDNDRRYMAYGRKKHGMPVLALLLLARARTRVRFPSCLKFLPFAHFGELWEVAREEIDEFYGPVATKILSVIPFRD
ncbi:MAG: hypothetical protein OXK79_11260 [Chloroflexota bacterium]|nr:hypothetical protein [Chloroflexota bacterium]